jgi:hypothetical protein
LPRDERPRAPPAPRCQAAAIKGLFLNLGRKKKAIGALAPMAVGLFSHFQNGEAVADGRVHPAGGCGFDAL